MRHWIMNHDPSGTDPERDASLRGEPQLLDLIDDPIAEMLRQRDRIDRAVVLAAVEDALTRLNPPRRS